MWYIISILVLLLVGMMDGHVSSILAMFFMFALGFISVNSMKNTSQRLYGGKVFGVVFSVYLISAFIASQSFLNGQSFYVDDALKYIEKYGDVKTMDWEDVIQALVQQFLFFNDNNGLYNAGLSYWSYFANVYYDGASVLYLTLLQTLFGLLASLEVYKIFLMYFDTQKAAKYTCVFALLSLFHIYSIVILRDIIIAYFYIWGIRKVISKPKITDIFVLLLVMLVTVGIRLYTGLFFGAFIMFWLYKLLQEKKYERFRFMLVPLIIFGIAFVGASLASSVLYERTAGQIEHYDDIYVDGSGLSTRLREFPIGVRHLLILFFSQLPLDSFHRFSISSSFSNYYLSFLAIIYQIFSFVAFYGLMYYCVFKGFFKRMDFNEKWILIILLLFMALNLSTHIDIRRPMAAIPFIFLFYLLVPDKDTRVEWLKVNKSLIAIGFLLMFAYAILK